MSGVGLTVTVEVVLDRDGELGEVVEVGDVDDVEAYVRTIVATLSVGDPDEREELVADGLELVARRHSTLRPGESLERALNGWLDWRLRDRWRERHPEWRRNARAATAYALPAPTGLAWEHDGGAQAGFPAPDERRGIESRLSLERFQDEAELRDPRLVGGYLGVPSWRALATGTAREIWAAIEAERQLTSESLARSRPLLPSWPTCSRQTGGPARP